MPDDCEQAHTRECETGVTLRMGRARNKGIVRGRQYLFVENTLDLDLDLDRDLDRDRARARARAPVYTKPVASL